MLTIILPYAGNLGYEFLNWGKKLPKDFKVKSIIYAGRGARMAEAFDLTWGNMVNDAYKQVLDLIKDKKEEYILLGHSLGGILLYSIYYKLVLNNEKLPKKVFFCGCNSPIKQGKQEKLGNLGAKEFEKYFIELGRINDSILLNEELKKIVFDVLYNDIRLLDLFEYKSHVCKIKSEIYVINGEDDCSCTFEEWNDISNNHIGYITTRGGHFFLLEHEDEMLDIIVKKVKENN